MGAGLLGFGVDVVCFRGFFIIDEEQFDGIFVMYFSEVK